MHPARGRSYGHDAGCVRRDYGHGAIAGVWTVMGVDVGRVLHGVIWVIDPTPGEPAVWARVLVERPSHPLHKIVRL